MRSLARRQTQQIVWIGLAVQLLMAVVGFLVGFYHSTHDKWVLGAVGALAGMAVFVVLVWAVGVPIALHLRRKQDQTS